MSGWLRNRARGDDGAVLVEAALVLPVLATLLLGAFEFGMGWRQNAYQSGAIAMGIRQLANYGSTRQADQAALQAVMGGMAGTKNMTVVKVVIFKSTSTGAPSDARCLTDAPRSGSSGWGYSGRCNIYGPDQLNNLTNTAYFGAANATSCQSSNADNRYCPTSRKDRQGDPPDFVGIYIESTYTTYTKIVGTSIRMTDRTSMQIEPKVT